MPSDAKELATSFMAHWFGKGVRYRGNLLDATVAMEALLESYAAGREKAARAKGEVSGKIEALESVHTWVMETTMHLSSSEAICRHTEGILNALYEKQSALRGESKEPGNG